LGSHEVQTKSNIASPSHTCPNRDPLQHARVSDSGLQWLRCQIFSLLRLQDSGCYLCKLWIGGKWQVIHSRSHSQRSGGGEMVRKLILQLPLSMSNLHAGLTRKTPSTILPGQSKTRTNWLQDREMAVLSCSTLAWINSPFSPGRSMREKSFRCTGIS
jgi:hypothetical protein